MPTVLIAGGGVVGLSTAVFLATHGVSCQVVERRAGPSMHPRARGFNPRTVELFRSVGLEPAVLEASRGFADHTLRARVESLAGRELGRMDLPSGTDLGQISPSPWALCSQDRLEPVLRKRAEELGVPLLFGTELVSFEQDDLGVTAVVRGESESRLRTSYLIGADGMGSRVRRLLGIALSGLGGLHHQLSILFEAELAGPLRDRRFAICQVHNPQVQGLLVHDDTLRRGTLYVRTDENLSEERCAELVAAAIGDPRIAVKILGTQSWQLSAMTADNYRAGRVFLAGDSAHIMPPVSGFGASTGIQDAHNLAWKLAFAHRHGAGPGLLDSYEAERAPIGAFTVDQCLRRITTRTGFGRPAATTGLVDELALTFGYRYRSSAVLGADEFDGVIDPAKLAAQPGTRAPHLPLCRDGEPLSALDLFGRSFVVLAGPGGDRWLPAAEEASRRLDLPVPAHLVGTDLADVSGAWNDRYGAAAVLVRPDGIVAWRAPADAADPARELYAALEEVLDRGDKQ